MDRLKGYLRPACYYGGLPLVKAASRRLLSRQRLFILMYHRVDLKAPPLYERVVRPAVFQKQVAFLTKHFEIVDLPRLKEARRRWFHKDLVAITFDDGYRDNYTYAFPLLKKYGVPATVFLATACIGTDHLLWYDKIARMLHRNRAVPDLKKLLSDQGLPGTGSEVAGFFSANNEERDGIMRSLVGRIKALPSGARKGLLAGLAKIGEVNSRHEKEDRAMLNWEEVREMSRCNISFGCHTHSHPFLSSLSEQEARAEITGSKRLIEGRIQRPVTTFAYPYGKPEDYRSEYIFRILEEGGFEFACSTERGAETFPIRRPLELKRRGVAPHPYLFL